MVIKSNSSVSVFISRWFNVDIIEWRYFAWRYFAGDSSSVDPYTVIGTDILVTPYMKSHQPFLCPTISFPYILILVQTGSNLCSRSPFTWLPPAMSVSPFTFLSTAHSLPYNLVRSRPSSPPVVLCVLGLAGYEPVFWFQDNEKVIVISISYLKRILTETQILVFHLI